MVDDEKVILHSNDVFSVEVRGFDHIPEPERNMTLRQVDQFWVGNSVNLLSFTLGALAIAEGLSLPWLSSPVSSAAFSTPMWDLHRLWPYEPDYPRAR
jgi:cytosine/uracil/thiamine/allantoin permease